MGSFNFPTEASTAQSIILQLHAPTNAEVEEATEFLEEHLLEGPLPPKTLYLVAEFLDISRIALKYAKQGLKIRGQYVDCDWMWGLPPEPG